MNNKQLFGVVAISTMMFLFFGASLAVSSVEDEQPVEVDRPGVPGKPIWVGGTTPTVKTISGRIENGETITINGSGFGNAGGLATASGNQVSPATRRFVLGNSLAFENCTWLKVQVPLYWSANKVDLSLNLTLVEEGDTVYLFFVQENRVVRPGYILESGLEKNEDTPGMPGMPSISH